MDTLNKSKLLNLIRLYGPISRTALSDMIDISLPAVTKHINELIAEGIICEAGTEKSQGGRRPVLLDLDMDYGYIIGIDFGQSFFRICSLDLKNRIMTKKCLPSSELGTPEEGIKRIVGLIDETINGAGPSKRPLAIGIAVSGIIKNGDGSSIMMPNLAGWNDVDFSTPIRQKFNLPVYIDDSARMMALCECVTPGGGRCKNLIFISLGTGVGTGIIVFGRLLRGAGGKAGELGHIIVKEGGNICGCGNRGCLEQYASVPAMVSSAKKAISEGVRSSILEFASMDMEQINSYNISKAVAERDKLAYSIAVEAGSYLGAGISQIINLFNPEYIYIGGGGAEISGLIIDEVVKTAQIRALNDSVKNVSIMKSDKGEYCAVIGASIFAQDNLFDLPRIQENNLF